MSGFMDYGPEWPPPPQPPAPQPPACRRKTWRTSRAHAVWFGFRLAWIAILVALGAFAIASDGHESTIPFPMVSEWGSPHSTSTVSPPVSGHGHRGHPRPQ